MLEITSETKLRGGERKAMSTCRTLVLPKLPTPRLATGATITFVDSDKNMMHTFTAPLTQEDVQTLSALIDSHIPIRVEARGTMQVVLDKTELKAGVSAGLVTKIVARTAIAGG